MTHTTTLKAATAALVLATPFAAEPARADAGFKALAGVEAQPMTGAEMEATQGQGFEWDPRTQRVVWNYNGHPLLATGYQNWGAIQHYATTASDTGKYYLYFLWTGQYFWSPRTGNWFAPYNGDVWNPAGQLIENRETVRIARERWFADVAGKNFGTLVENYLVPRY